MSRTLRPLPSYAVVVTTSLLLGALTSWAQGVLPDALASFANSPSGWTALTAVAVGVTRPPLVRGAVLGAVSFVALVLGYTVASELRGLSYDPALWGAIGLLAGPFVGAAAAALVGPRALHAAVGAGVLTGVLVADGIYGLTVVSATTSPVYWVLCLAAGAVLAGATIARVRRPLPALLTLATATAATGVLTVGYAVLNSGV